MKNFDLSKSLTEALSSPVRKRVYNRRLFTTIAPRYDLITRLLSYGQDQAWKARLVALAEVRPGQTALDVACGTGDLAIRLRDAGARVTGLDLTPAMLERARRAADLAGSGRASRDTRRISLVAGDIGALPIADASVDLVTGGYALRNVPDLPVALRELARVLRPGGRLLSLDFNRPSPSSVRAAYEAYLWTVGSALGLVLHRDPDTYRYIWASLRRYPEAAEVAAQMRAAGFADVRWMPVLGGLMAIHVARR